jgi:hypothetical protein
MSSEPKQLFTLEQANATLPLVRAITRDLAKISFDVFERHQQLHRVMAGREVDDSSPYSEELAQVKQDLDEQAGRLEEYLVELKQLGVEPRNGPGGRIDTVDFPSERNGRTVYLCWQLGEQEISHWHDLEAGFAGRQQLFAGANAEEER